MSTRPFRSHKMEPLPCPSCGKVLNMADGLEADAGPAAGDLSICVYCAHLMVFEGDALRTPTDEERAEAMRDRNVRRVISVTKAMIENRKLREQTDALVRAAIAGRRSRLN